MNLKIEVFRSSVGRIKRSDSTFFLRTRCRIATLDPNHIFCYGASGIRGDLMMYLVSGKDC